MSTRPARSDANRSYRLWLALILVVGAAIRAKIAIIDPLLLEEAVIDEDAYYYFNIARNIAMGEGVRHDSFHQTNGFQPLYCFLIAPLFLAFSDQAWVLNAVLFLQIAIGVASGATLYGIARLVSAPRPALLAPALWAVSASFVFLELNGMETGTAFLLLCLVTYGYLRGFALRTEPGLPSLSRHAALGGILGLAFLARVDLGLLTPIVVLDHLWRHRRSEDRGSVLTGAAVTVACAAAVMLPWLAYNVYLDGKLLPSSGQAVRFMSLAFGFRFLPNRFGGDAFPVDEIPLAYYLASVEVALVSIYHILSRIAPLWLGGALLVGAWAASRRELSRNLQKWSFVWPFLVLLFVAYTTYIFGQWYFDRYFLPFALAYLLVIAVSAHAIERARNGTATLAIVAGVLVTAAAWKTWAYHDVVVARREPGERYQVTRYLNESTEPDAVIGAFQTGIVGYYLERDFVSLDGKTNAGALAAMQQGEIDEYITRAGVDYLLDWPLALEDLLTRRARDPDFLSQQPLVAETPRYHVYRLVRPARDGRASPDEAHRE